MSSYLGKKSLHIYLCVLLGLLYFNAYYKEYTNIIEITLSFYKIGSIMIGGAPIMVPFIYSETEKNSLNITSDAFWISFGLAASLVFNLINLLAWSIFEFCHLFRCNKFWYNRRNLLLGCFIPSLSSLNLGFTTPLEYTWNKLIFY